MPRMDTNINKTLLPFIRRTLMGFSFLVIFIIFGFWLNFERKKGINQGQQVSQKYWERERQANSTRKKPTNQIHYITISEKSLPFIEIQDKILENCQKKLEILKNKEIANFSGMSNTDLKLEYGVANLTYLQTLDENYIQLMYVLREYGLRLLELKHLPEAKQVLEFALENGTDSPAIYRALRDIYLQENAADSIEYLEFKAKQTESIQRDTLLAILDDNHEFADE